MPKAQSDSEPPQFVKSRGKTQVNYNASERKGVSQEALEGCACDAEDEV